MRLAPALLVLLTCASAQAQFPFDDESPPAPLVAEYPLNTSGTWAETPAPTMGITFGRAVAATYAAEVGGQSFTVNSTPTRVSDQTWPAGLSGATGYGWTLDGSDDYLSNTTISAATTDMTVCAVVSYNSTSTDPKDIMSRCGSAPNYGWSLYNYLNSVRFAMSSDGDTGAGLSSAASVGACSRYTPCFVCATYHYITSGTSVITIYKDGETPVVNSTATGPIYSATANFGVGSRSGGSLYYPGTIHHAAYWGDVALTATQIAALRNQWRGLLATNGSAVTATSATPPAAMLAYPALDQYPIFQDMPANTWQVGSAASGAGGIYSAAAITNLVQRGSYTTWAAGAPTGWTEGITSTGDCADDSNVYAHNSHAARCTNADADDAITLTSACATVTEATAYYVSAYAVKISGTALLDINVLEDDSADCGSITTTTAVVNDAVPTTSFARYGGPITTQAGTIRAQVQISLPAAAAQVLTIDGVMLRAGSTPTDALCTTDADASAVCTAVTFSIASPLSAAGAMTIAGTWRTPYAGADIVSGAKYLLSDSAGGASPNEYLIYLHADTDEAVFLVSDGASGIKYVAPNVANWAANTDYTVKARAAGGVLGLYWNSVWQTTTAGAGLGYRSAKQSYAYIGYDPDDVSSDSWSRDLLFYRRVLQ